MTVFLVTVGVLGLIFRRPLARLFIFVGRRTRLPEGKRSIDQQLRVQDVTALMFIALGLIFATLGLFGWQPFGVPVPGMRPA